MTNKTVRAFFGVVRRAIVAVPVLLLVLSMQCQLPPGCGPGAVTTNPYVSNLVDYTDPPSGMIMHKSEFNKLTFYFFELVDRDSFDLINQMRLIRIENFWSADENNPWREIALPEIALPGVFSYEWECVSDVQDPGYDERCESPPIPSAANKLVLNVNNAYPFLIEEDRHYRIELLGRCPEGVTWDCTDNPITSWDGHRLDSNVNIFIGLYIEEGAQEQPGDWYEAPFIWLTSPDWLSEDPGTTFVRPHERIRLLFSQEHIGFVNLLVSPLWGFNFRYNYETAFDWTFMVLESDSIQGLYPGTQYNLDIISEDQADTLTPGLPPTMDRYGNTLRAGPLTTGPESVYHTFNTSHVRIWFPFHKPFSDEPDNWGDQLSGRYQDPYIIVEASSAVIEQGGNNIPLVAKITDTGPNGVQSDVCFSDVVITTPGEVVSIDIEDIAHDGPGEESILEVHAYDAEDNWLGSDKMEVYSYPVLFSFIESNSRISDAIVWEDEDEGPINWPNWSWTKRVDFLDAFRKTKDWFDRGMTGSEPINLTDPLPNIYNQISPENRTEQVLSKEDAWDLYIAYVAFSLVVEYYNIVPWSLNEQREPVGDEVDPLFYLLDSRNMFTWNGYGYYIDDDESGFSLPSPPAFTFTFLVNESIIDTNSISSTEAMKNTVSKLLEWFRDNDIVHFADGFYFGNVFNHWQYMGMTPVSYLIKQTTCEHHYIPGVDFAQDEERPHTCPEGQRGHFTAGCWGTDGFVKSVLRTLNIPVRIRTKAWHNQAEFLFPEYSLYLPHGDDPYYVGYKYNVTPLPLEEGPGWFTYPIPGYETLIDEDTYVNWFQRGSPDDWAKNIARRKHEIEMTFLTTWLLKKYCYDVDHSNQPQNSCVYSYLSNVFTFDELLNDWNIWNNLQNDVLLIGGCSEVWNLTIGDIYLPTYSGCED